MATEEKPVHEQVQDLLASWNPPPTDDGITRLVGDQADKRDPAMDHDRNPGLSSIDAERMFTDDGDDDEDAGDVSYDDMTKAELQAEIDSRNADRDEDDHLSKSGNKADLVARLEEDDDEDDSDEE